MEDLGVDGWILTYRFILSKKKKKNLTPFPLNSMIEETIAKLHLAYQWPSPTMSSTIYSHILKYTIKSSIVEIRHGDAH